ncbi:hypothetical protein LINPERHAP2_LOCUS19395, partial [Linum perenne]
NANCDNFSGVCVSVCNSSGSSNGMKDHSMY